MVLVFVEGFDVYGGDPSPKPQLQLVVSRYWHNGKLIGTQPPFGSYHVRLLKKQTDALGRLQYHWDLISYNPLDFRSSHPRGL